MFLYGTRAEREYSWCLQHASRAGVQPFWNPDNLWLILTPSFDGNTDYYYYGNDGILYHEPTDYSVVAYRKEGASR